MKKITIYLLGFIAGIFSGCNSLDLAPIDYYASGNYWENESQVDAFMNGLHTEFRDNYNLLYQLGEERGGTQRTTTASQGNSLNEVNPIKINNFTSASTGISNWCGLYDGILKINTFIINVEEGCEFLDPDSRSYYLGQAYGLRAFYYFLLYRTYGGLPMLLDDRVIQGETDATVFYVPRSTPRQTLDQIKADVNKSITCFAERNRPGTRSYWTLGASLALKSEVYLWSGKVSLDDQTPAPDNADLIEARTALDKLLGMADYGLEKDFSHIFSSDNKGGKEIILAFRFKEGEAENNIQTLYQINAFVGNAFDINGKKITTDILDMRVERQQRHEYLFDFWRSFDAGDTRRDYTFLAYYKGVLLPPNLLVKSDSGTLMKKYMGKINASDTRIYESDIPVYRYSNLLLMRAEVENALGGDPMPYINKVRRRAYGVDIDSPSAFDLSKGTFAENELAILRERDKEFVWEGTRWFDLCRMQDANHEPLVFAPEASYILDQVTHVQIPVLDKETEKHMLLWPIDVKTLNGNPKLKQNPGY